MRRRDFLAIGGAFAAKAMLGFPVSTAFAAGVPPVEFGRYPARRAFSDASRGTVLSDIESHLPAGHPYREPDTMTWAHEGCHGVNGYLREFVRQRRPGHINAFYCLGDRFVTFTEPPFSLPSVAQRLPRRGSRHQQLFARDWVGEPLYAMDEWVSYTAGALAGCEALVKRLGWFRSFDNRLTGMLEYGVYALGVVVQACQTAAYRDAAALRAFTRWNLARSFGAYRMGKAHDFGMTPWLQTYAGSNWVSDGTRRLFGGDIYDQLLRQYGIV